MIKIKPEISTFKAPVRVTPFGGEAETITIEFAYMPVSKAMELAKKKTVGEVLAEIVKSWDGIDAPFTPEALSDLLDHNPAIGMDLFQGYFAAMAETRAKN